MKAYQANYRKQDIQKCITRLLSATRASIFCWFNSSGRSRSESLTFSTAKQGTTKFFKATSIKMDQQHGVNKYMSNSTQLLYFFFTKKKRETKKIKIQAVYCLNRQLVLMHSFYSMRLLIISTCGIAVRMLLKHYQISSSQI